MDISQYVVVAPPPRGFPVSVIGARDETKYRCSFCKLILRNPVQSFCGHRYCKNCVEYLTRQENVTCPSCVSEQVETEESLLDMSKIFPDNATKRELNKLPAKCPNEGCSWTGALKTYEEHEGSCSYRVEYCACGGKFAPSEYDEHLRSHCPYRLIVCEFCQKQYQFKNKDAHLTICTKLPITCHRCSEEGIPRDMMENHLLQPECRPRSRCPYGCGALVEEGGMDLHVHSAAVKHLEVVFNNLSSLNTRLDQGLATVQGEIESLAITAQAEGGAAGGSHKDCREERMETNESSELEEGMRKDEVLESAVVVLQREIEKTRKKTDELLNQRDRDLDRIAVLERRVQELNLPGPQSLTLEDLPNHDGTLIWKITNFSEKRQEALNGTAPGITSAPFYTSRTGYKLCGRVYLDGDGMGKGTHLSVFIVVMRGNYDPLLRWPFRQKVTMTLLDQSLKRRHVLDAFRPDPSSASFQRPRADMNTASGCPMFVPLTDILQQSPGPDDPHFLKEDTIFIKLHVDTSSLAEI